MRRYGTIKCYRMDDDTLKILDSNIDRINSQRSGKKKINEAAYIRDLIHRDYQAALGFSSDEFLTISRILAGVGNNINQIAHNTNNQVFSPYDASHLQEGLNTLSEIKNILVEIRKRV